MILDRYNEFCDNVALNTGGAGTYLLGNQIDLVYPRDIGHGNTNHLYLVIVVTETATSGGSATLQLTLASDATASIATNGTATEHISTAVFPVAQLNAGKVLLVTPLPLEGPVYEKFVGILQKTGTAAFTAGRIDAFLTPTPQVWKAHADEASR
jgi:hypothetical protein